MEPLDRRVNEFLLGVHESSRRLEPLALQREALQQLRRLIDFDFAIWGAGSGMERNVHTAVVLDQDPRLFDSWEGVKHDDPYVSLLIEKSGRACSLDDAPGARQSRAYLEHWRRYGAGQMLSTLEQDHETGLHLFLSLCRDSERGAFSDAERQLKGMLTRHLFLAARTSEQFTLLRNSATQGGAIVDRHGRVHSSLPRFEELATQEWGEAARHTLPLSEAILVAGGSVGKEVCLNATPLGDRYIVRLRPCSALDRLSRREREIALSYARGESHKKVARALSLSPNTVRNHLQSIYRKLDIRDKAELARLCSAP
ncbi:MAG: response regulator transcription factor [Pseudomonadota bacterium]